MTQSTTGKTVGIPTFQFWESNAAQSTSLQAFQQALSRTADPMAEGTYKLTWYFELRIVPTGAIDGHMEARFEVDDVTKGSASWYHEEWTSFAGWDRYNATAGEMPVFDIDFRRQGGGDDSVEIRKLKIGLERMDTSP